MESRFYEPHGEGTTRVCRWTGRVARLTGSWQLGAGGCSALQSPGDVAEVSDNLASENRENGIATSSIQGEVRITHNTVAFNGRHGIAAEEGSASNEILSNTALGNGTFDLSDGNRDCQNMWADNTFGTSSGPCTH